MDPIGLYNTPYNLVQMLWQAIDVIEAREILQQMTIADWPRTKPSKRKELHRNLWKTAYPKLMKEKSMDLDSLEKTLRAMNGGQ